jgi:hypothetical protein
MLTGNFGLNVGRVNVLTLLQALQGMLQCKTTREVRMKISILLFNVGLARFVKILSHKVILFSLIAVPLGIDAPTKYTTALTWLRISERQYRPISILSTAKTY